MNRRRFLLGLISAPAIAAPAVSLAHRVPLACGGSPADVVPVWDVLDLSGRNVTVHLQVKAIDAKSAAEVLIENKDVILTLFRDRYKKT